MICIKMFKEMEVLTEGANSRKNTFLSHVIRSNETCK